MFARFKAAKCNVQLKQCASRIQLLQNQREMRVVQMKREIAELLRAGKETRAILQVEQKLREEATIAAYSVIVASCHTLCAQMPMIEGNKKCPHDLKREIATIIFAAPRCGDLPELQQLQAMFTAKFGKEFAASASELRPDCGVDKRVIDALTVRAPSGEASLQALAAIAAEHHVDWTPATLQQDGAEASPYARGGPFGSPPRSDSRSTITRSQTPPTASPFPAPHWFQSPTPKPASINPVSPSHVGPAAYSMTEPGVYRPPPSPDTPLRPRTGEDPFGRRGSGASRRGPTAGDPLVSPSEGSPRFPTPAGEERSRYYSGDARSPRAWEENPDAAVAALAVTAEQMTYLAQAVVASHARERESRLREKLRAERGSEQGGDYPTADESPNAARAQRREEGHTWENANGNLEAHLGANDGDNKRHWDGESSQQRWPRNAEQFDNVHGGGNGVPEGAWGRVAPPSGDMSGAGHGMEVRSPQQRPGAAHAPRPTSPDSLAARSSEEHRGSSEDEDGLPAREGASRDGKLDRLRHSDRETRTRKSSSETRGWSEGGEQPAAGFAKGAPVAAGQTGYVFPQDKKHSAAVARPHTVERPGRGPLPPPPKLHVERGRFFKATAPSTAGDHFDLPPASPDPETDDLAARMRALRFKR